VPKLFGDVFINAEEINNISLPNIMFNKALPRNYLMPENCSTQLTCSVSQ